MTVPLTGTGGLFTRLGKLIGGLNELNTFRGTTIGTRATSIQGQYTSAEQQVIDSLFSGRDSYRSGHGTWVSLLQNETNNTVIQMANDDTPLASLDVTTAWKLIIAQMTTAVASINASVPAASVVAGGSNVGNGVLVASVIGTDGKKSEYILPEALVATITQDAIRGATAGREPFTIKGTAAAISLTDWSFPKGSAASVNGQAVDATTNNTTNLLNNSDFETFSPANTPANWNILVGTAGTTIFAGGSGNAYTGGNVLQYQGNASELTSIYQLFGNSSTGATQSLKPSTVYAVNLVTKVSAVPVAGVLEVALTDGNNNVINNDAGTANLFTISLPGETTAFAFHNTFFQTPTLLPATHRIRVRLSTALDNAKSVYIDHLALQQAVAIPSSTGLVGTFYVALFGGSTAFALNDTWTVTVTNTQGAFQKGLWQIMNLPSLGVRIPTSASPTISDTLVS